MSDSLLATCAMASTNTSPFNWTLIASLQNTDASNLNTIKLNTSLLMPYEMLEFVVSVPYAFTIISNHSAGNGYIYLCNNSIACFYEDTTVQPQSLGNYFMVRDFYNSFEGTAEITYTFRGIASENYYFSFRNTTSTEYQFFSVNRITQFSRSRCIQLDIYGTNLS